MIERLLLVRHGEVHNPDHVVYADLPGFPLTDRGRTQAAEAAGAVAHVVRDVVTSSGPIVLVASPLQRAVETAEPIAAALGVPVATDERLVEWRLGNRWAGVGWDVVDEVFPGELTAYLEDPEDLPFSPESIRAAADRVVAVVNEIAEHRPGATAVLVGHQDPTQAARLALTGRPLSALHTDKPDHGTVFVLEPGDPWKEVRRIDPPSAGDPFPPSATELDDGA